MKTRKKFEYLRDEAEAVLSGKVEPGDTRLRHRAISAKGVPVGLWRKFGMMAKEREMTLPEALTNAVVLWVNTHKEKS